MQIQNNVFIITGGASGLGAATARMITEAGGKVVIADVQAEAGAKLAQELGGQFVKCDVTSEADAQAVVAQQIRQAVKSKYDLSVWLDKMTPLEDALREKKRDALVTYLVETSLRTENPELEVGGKRYGNPRYWQDANDLRNLSKRE